MRGARIMLACVLALVGAACGGDGGGSAEVAADLGAAILPEGPPGFRTATAADGLPLGAFDLAEFLDVYSTEPGDDRALLAGNDLVAGFTRTWIDDESSAVATVIAFAFEDGRGARAVHQAFVDDAVTTGGGMRFAVPGIPGATGVNGTEATEGGVQYVQSVSFADGPRLFTAALVTPDEPADTGDIVTFARRQSAHG